jgi:hypothetical protein
MPVRSGAVGADEEILAPCTPGGGDELGPACSGSGRGALFGGGLDCHPRCDSALDRYSRAWAELNRASRRTGSPWSSCWRTCTGPDEMSLRLLAFVSRRIPAWPVLLIATAREEELTEASHRPGWNRPRGANPRAADPMPMVLSPLSRSVTTLLVSVPLPVPGGTAATMAPVGKSGSGPWSVGNPFVTVGKACAPSIRNSLGACRALR